VHSIEQQFLEDVPFVWYSRYSSFLTVDTQVHDLVNFYDQRTLFDEVWLAATKK
jgi:hypothetical protein